MRESLRRTVGTQDFRYLAQLFAADFDVIDLDDRREHLFDCEYDLRLITRFHLPSRQRLRSIP